MTIDSGGQKRRKFGFLRRVLVGGMGLILVTAVLLFLAYNYDLYKGHSACEGTLVIHGGTLFDGTGIAPYKNIIIVIKNDRIVSVGNRAEVPSDATRVDATGLFIMPGLIDLHVHFGAPSQENSGQSFPRMMWDYIRQRPAVRRALHEAGVTTIRSVGDAKNSILGLKKQIASRDLAGPRVYCVGPIFTAPGGHPAGTIYKGNPWLIKNATRQVSDPNAARTEVQKLAHEGVDGIKAVYSGGGKLPRLSLHVLQAIIDEAHKQSLWVAVHTASIKEVREAVRAGANTIEHGVTRKSQLDSATIALLREKNVTYIPTLAVAAAMLKPGKEEAMKLVMQNTKAAKDAGIRIGSGTDTQGKRMSFGESMHRELELLVQAGLSPEESLLSATRDAAIALQADKDLGTIESGKIADLVLIDGEPWKQINDLRRIRLVIQAGRVVVDKRQSTRGE